MKRFLFPLILSLAVMVSCGPSRHAVHVEMRYPSKSGLELAGKIVSVVYLENEDVNATSFTEGMADGFAHALEQDYGTGEGSIGVYRMRYQEGENFASKESLMNLIIDTDSDLVVLFDPVELGTLQLGGAGRVASPSSPSESYLNSGSIDFSMAMHCFDGMDKTEQVYSFLGSSTAEPVVYSDGTLSSTQLMKKAYENLASEGWEAGELIAESFKSQWRHEQYSLTYFDNEKWYKALDRAEAYDWKGAMDMWITLLSTNDPLKRACAEYNIATACYMLGDYDLATGWLNQSDKDNKLPYSDALRKRINERTSR